MKVEVFFSVEQVKLQTQINEFIKIHDGIEIIEINFQHTVDKGDHYFSALLLYRA